MSRVGRVVLTLSLPSATRTIWGGGRSPLVAVVSVIETTYDGIGQPTDSVFANSDSNPPG